MRRNQIIFLLVILVIVAVVVYAATRVNRSEPGQTAGSGQPLQEVGKPKLVATDFNGCPPSGDGGDPVLNTLKNRIDESRWQPTTLEALVALSWPKSIERQSHARWSSSDAQAIAEQEGAPVTVEGYLVSAKKQSPESCNCHAVDQVDYHMWLADSPNSGRENALVVEITPRVRVYHQAWSLSRMSSIISRHEKVRISGWLMMDPEHPDQIGKTRATIWEIHPVMQVETFSGGRWQPLDGGSTGVNSASAAAQTAPPVTPEEPATMPPNANPNVQDNKTVQITKVFADGKGSTEPDEYVEISNGGSEPVDITDWTLQDDTGADLYKWDSFTVQPGSSIRVYTNEAHPEWGGFDLHSARPVWRNAGDVAELFDADKALVSRYAYGNKR